VVTAAVETATVETATVETATVESTAVETIMVEAIMVEAIMKAVMEPADPNEGRATEIVRIAVVSGISTGTVSVGITTVVNCPGTRRKHQADRREQQYFQS
jgi:hypothetical protein